MVAGHGAARADERQLGGGLHHGLRQGGGDAAQQIERQILEVAHGVLDVVAEHPQEHHVRCQMDHVRVQEHVGEKRQRLRDGEGIEWSVR